MKKITLLLLAAGLSAAAILPARAETNPHTRTETVSGPDKSDRTLVSRQYDVAPFQSIRAASFLDISLTRGSVCKVEITCLKEFEPYITVSSENGVLSLNTDLPQARSGKIKIDDSSFIRVKIQMPWLDGLHLSGLSSLSATGKFSSEQFTCELSGTASVGHLNINAKRLICNLRGISGLSVEGNSGYVSGEISGSSKFSFTGDCDTLALKCSGITRGTYSGHVRQNIRAEVSGASALTLEGSADKLNVKVSGSSECEARQMKAADVVIRTSGVSKAVVHGDRTIDAGASGASKITHYGKGELTFAPPRNIQPGK